MDGWHMDDKGVSSNKLWVIMCFWTLIQFNFLHLRQLMSALTSIPYSLTSIPYSLTSIPYSLTSIRYCLTSSPYSLTFIPY